MTQQGPNGDGSTAAAPQTQDGPASEPVVDNRQNGEGSHGHGFWAMALGSVGVVYGDIGTSPLYALKASLEHTKQTGTHATEIVGIVSLLIWALIFIVTVKYVLFIMRADNKGEGGTLSLMALAQHAVGKRTMPIF
ncbi:MAG: KUP/HAK/KT family potassium transporter, partial [Hyphomicrobiales bacterium]|nr:KUP/HAK/KT family potassium transporter [Hyphomicrobiales bacterium]